MPPPSHVPFPAPAGAPTLVTGAGGFIGGKIVERLLAEGRAVRTFGRRALPHFAARGVECVAGDLTDAAAVAGACAGVGTVFHVAGRVGVWGPAAEFFRVNVEGTRHVLDAARTAGVARVVYTSSPSVVYGGGDLAGADESRPLCARAPCAYPTSKAAAERLALAANSPALRTVALRPHLVWGPGDENLLPRVLALAKRGKLRIVGRGKNRVDVTHVDNVVDAHLLAERALLDPASPAAGRAYFVTNGEPVALWPWLGEVCARAGVPPIRGRVPLPVAYAAGALGELVWTLLRRAGDPPMTRFVAKELATDHWFSIAAARRDLGYAPRVSLAQGLDALAPELRRRFA